MLFKFQLAEPPQQVSAAWETGRTFPPCGRASVGLLSRAARIDRANRIAATQASADPRRVAAEGPALAALRIVKQVKDWFYSAMQRMEYPYRRLLLLVSALLL